MPIIESSQEGPYTLHVVGKSDDDQPIDGLLSRYPDGPPNGEKDRPRTFNDLKQVEKWLAANVSPEQIEALEWRVITTTEAMIMRGDLAIDAETKKFV